MNWLLNTLRRNDPWTEWDFDAEEAVVKGTAIQAGVFMDEEPIVPSHWDIPTLLSLGIVRALLPE